MNEAEENRIREDLERQHGRITAVRSKGRAAFFFRPATFDEWRAFKTLGGDDVLVSETLTVACCVWSAEGLDVAEVARENGNFGIAVAGKVRLISGGDCKVATSVEAGTTTLSEQDGTELLTFHKPPFPEIQRYTASIKRTQHQLDPMLTYLLGSVDGDRKAAEETLRRLPAAIPAIVDSIELLGAGDFDFEGN